MNDGIIVKYKLDTAQTAGESNSEIFVISLGRRHGFSSSENIMILDQGKGFADL
jgi:hypothetical protein